MVSRETVSPATLQLEVEEDGIVVHYLDGRHTVYSQTPEAETAPITMPPEFIVQILLVHPSQTEGVLVYVNDRDTADEILEESGVGRINLRPGEAASILPGIDVEMDGHTAVVDVDHEVVDGEVYVFAEGQLGSRAYHVVEDAE